MKRTETPDDVMEKGGPDSAKSLDPMMPAGNTTPGQAHTSPMPRTESDGVAVRGTGLPTFAGVRGAVRHMSDMCQTYHASARQLSDIHVSATYRT